MARMPLNPDSPEFKQLMEQIDRDLLAMARLRVLLTENDEAGLHRELHVVRHRSARVAKIGQGE
jgi:hypothetical protein